MMDDEAAYAEEMASSKSAVRAIERASEEDRLEYEKLLQVIEFLLTVFESCNKFCRHNHSASVSYLHIDLIFSRPHQRR